MQAKQGYVSNVSNTLRIITKWRTYFVIELTWRIVFLRWCNTAAAMRTLRPGPITYESESENYQKNDTSHTCSAAYTAFEHLGHIGVPPNIRLLISFKFLTLPLLCLRNADSGDRIVHIADPEIFELQIISANASLSSLSSQLHFSSLFHDIKL